MNELAEMRLAGFMSFEAADSNRLARAYNIKIGSWIFERIIMYANQSICQVLISSPRIKRRLSLCVCVSMCLCLAARLNHHETGSQTNSTSLSNDPPRAFVARFTCTIQQTRPRFKVTPNGVPSGGYNYSEYIIRVVDSISSWHLFPVLNISANFALIEPFKHLKDSNPIHEPSKCASDKCKRYSCPLRAIELGWSLRSI